MKKKTQNAILISFFLATILFSCCTHLADDRKSSEFNFSENNLDLGVSSLQDWVKSWGYNETDHGYSVAIDSSGNSYIAGDVYQNGALNATVIKYDTSGVYQWHKTWGGSSTETAQSIYIDLSDYVYITGKARSFNTTDDVFIVKYDSNGNLIWNRTWGGSGNDIGIDLTVDSQGNAYIAGITSSYGPGGQNVIFLIYNSTGHLQDSKIWGGNSDDRANAIVKDSNGNTFIMGETGSFGAGNADVFLLKYNTSRDLEWNTTWGSNTLDRPGDLAIDSNNDLYISGFTYHPDIGTGDENFFIAKFSSSGLPIWSEIWGSKYMDLGVSVAIDSDNNAYFTGYTQGYDAGIQDIYLAKFSSDGVKQWECLWDSGDTDVVHEIYIDKSSNDIFLAGESKGFVLDKNYQIILIKNPSTPETSPPNPSGQNIPGYDLVLLIGLISVISFVIFKKKEIF